MEKVSLKKNTFLLFAFFLTVNMTIDCMNGECASICGEACGVISAISGGWCPGGTCVGSSCCSDINDSGMFGNNCWPDYDNCGNDHWVTACTVPGLNKTVPFLPKGSSSLLSLEGLAITGFVVENIAIFSLGTIYICRNNLKKVYNKIFSRSGDKESGDTKLKEVKKEEEAEQGRDNLKVVIDESFEEIEDETVSDSTFESD